MPSRGARCSRCEQFKPRSDFPKQASTKSGLNSWCKECHAEYRYIRAYKLTPADAEYILEHQGYKCAICGYDLTNPKKRRLDHCHTHGHARGVLCNWCNVGLGHFRDDPEVLKAAIHYLENNTHEDAI